MAGAVPRERENNNDISAPSLIEADMEAPILLPSAATHCYVVLCGV